MQCCYSDKFPRFSSKFLISKFCSVPGIYSHDCISLDKYGLTVRSFILILIHEGNGQKLTYFIIAERKVKMYCYEKFLPELQRYLYWLVIEKTVQKRKSAQRFCTAK